MLNDNMVETIQDNDVSRYFIILSYNGSTFHGWQIQPNSVTVQGELNKAISLLLHDEVNVIGCGRTDTGVHARKFVAHFDTKHHNIDCSQLAYKLNSFLSNQISIHKIVKVAKDNHSRFDAIKRTYKYYISFNKDPFDYHYSLYITYPLDVDKMNKTAEQLFNYTDFTSFSKKHTDTKTNDCKIYKAEWCLLENNKLVFTIVADRFLRNMVRSVVGTLLDVGKGRVSEQEFCEIIEAKDRCKAKLSVPAKALFLEDIEYSYDI